jgi:hypothetical protein
LSSKDINQIKKTYKSILICDDDYIEGTPTLLAAKIMNLNSKVKKYMLGLPNKTAGHLLKLTYYHHLGHKLLKKRLCNF